MAAPGNLDLALELTSLALAILNCQSDLHVGQSKPGTRFIKVNPPSLIGAFVMAIST